MSHTEVKEKDNGASCHSHNQTESHSPFLEKYPLLKKSLNFSKRIRPFIVALFAIIILMTTLHAIIPDNEFLNNFYSIDKPYGIIFGSLSILMLYPKFLVGSIRSIKKRKLGMTFTITLSATIAYVLSLVLFILNRTNGEDYDLYFDAVVAILVFLSIGMMLEEKITSQGNFDIKEILKLKSTKVQKEDGNLASVFEVKKGERIVVNNNSDILVDGKIISGDTYVSESFLTGEVTPIRKGVGSYVQAGSNNLKNRIVVEVSRNLESSNISRIVQQSKQLAKAKPPLQKIADKISRWLILFEFIGLVLSFLYKYFLLKQGIVDSIVFSVSVFIIICPCALGILTPGVLMVSSSFLSKKNILIKNKNTMEEIKKAKTIAFDKTGTLVSNKLEVASWKGEENILRIAKGLESHSEHPIAKSLLSYKSEVPPFELENVSEEIGIGLKGTYKNKEYIIGGVKLIDKLGIKHKIESKEVVLICDRTVVGSFIVKSKENPKIKELIEKLKKQGYKTILLSGDKEENVKELASKFSFDDYKSQMTPEEKELEVKRLQEKSKVVFVGDGINDIIALSQANISVSIASDYNAFNLPSDVVIFEDQVSNIIPMIDILKKTRWFVLVGLMFSILYNVVTFLLVLFLSINPIIAAAAMVGSDIVILIIILIFKLLKLDKKKYY